MANRTSVVIADAHFLSRYALCKLLEELPDFEIIGEVGEESDLLQLMQKNKPHMVILDYDAPGAFSEGTIRKVKTIAPQTNILVISDVDSKKSIDQALTQGVHSFLTKSCGEKEVMDAMRATARGEKFFCTRVVDYLLEKSYTKPKKRSQSPLTPREIEIVKLVAKGLIAKEIADSLNLSTHTVYTHRKNIMKKLKLNTASELVLYAVRNGYVAGES